MFSAGTFRLYLEFHKLYHLVQPISAQVENILVMFEDHPWVFSKLYQLVTVFNGRSDWTANQRRPRKLA